MEAIGYVLISVYIAHRLAQRDGGVWLDYLPLAFLWPVYPLFYLLRHRETRRDKRRPGGPGQRTG